MKKNYVSVLVVIVTALLISGCLTCEKKEYTFVFTGENSGRLTIKYINLLSTMDDGEDISEDDFQALISDYYDGYELENEFPNAMLIEKRLFEENGVLCGEIVFEFNDLAAANLYRYRGTGPFMYCLSCYSIDSEYYAESNGEYGGEIMPVVFWEAGLKELTLTTDVTLPDETTVSLLGAYNDWKAGQ